MRQLYRKNNWGHASRKEALALLCGLVNLQMYICISAGSVIYEPVHEKNNKMACAPSEDSGQPAAQSDQSLNCPLEESLGPQLPIECTAKTLDQTGPLPRLIWVFAGRTVILLVLSWGSYMYCVKLPQVCIVCVQAGKAMARRYRCTCSPEPLPMW